MSIRPRRLGRAAALLVTATVVLLAAAGAAHADQATATTQVIDETATIPFTNPCNGETGTATITYKVIFHQTDRPVDTYSLVDNLSGDFVLVLDSGATITGHFVETGVIGGGENLTLSSVLTAQATARDNRGRGHPPPTADAVQPQGGRGRSRPHARDEVLRAAHAQSMDGDAGVESVIDDVIATRASRYFTARTIGGGYNRNWGLGRA